MSPGFIDTRAHPDRYLKSSDPKMREITPWVTQGVGTLFVGVDGGGYTRSWPTAFAKDEAGGGVGTNFVDYVGFGAIRKRVIGMDDRAPSVAELATEKTGRKGNVRGRDRLFNRPLLCPAEFLPKPMK